MAVYAPSAPDRTARNRADGRSAVSPPSAATVKKPSFSKLRAKSQDLILLTTQLSVMLDSGVALSDGISAISEQMRPGEFKLVVEDIAERLRNGECFSAALSAYPKIFSTMYISMVKASEASGRMAQMLEVLAGYLNSDAETRKQIKGAMVYPMVMLLTAVGATGSLMFFVLPRFSRIYESRGAALPKLTQVLVNFSTLLSDPMFFAIAVTSCVLSIFAFSVWNKTPSGQKTIDWLKIHTPVFNTMFIYAVLTRSMRILATMVNTGVSLLDAIEVMRTSCDNYFFRTMWASVDARIRDGYQLSEAITLSPHRELIASGIVQMLRAGEKSGQIARVCDKVSIFLDKKLQNSIRTATSLIEPLMILLMGLIIGTIAIALLLPVFRISSVIAH